MTSINRLVGIINRMAKPTTTELLRFVSGLILPMMSVKRDMIFPGSDRRENNAEHSWALAVIACALAPRIDPSLNVGLICQYAVIHDMPEIHAGDVSPFDHDAYTSVNKKEREAAAVKKIRADFGEYKWVHDTLTEYEKRDTPEAKFVYAVDKLLPLAYDLIDEGVYVRSAWKFSLEQYVRHLAPHREKAKAHPDVFEYYDAIFEELRRNPQFFS